MIRYILMVVLTVFIALFAIDVNNSYDKNYYDNSTPITITDEKKDEK